MDKHKVSQTEGNKTMDTQKVSIKLLIDKKGKRVLFGEAGKELVDFLFHIFSLPLGTLCQLLGSKEMVGCLGKLKESIETLGDSYLQAGVDKDCILYPKKVPNASIFRLSYGDDENESHQLPPSRTLYRCSTPLQEYSNNGKCKKCRCGVARYSNCKTSACRSYVTEYPNAKCPSCNALMNVVITSVVPLEKTEEVVAKTTKRKAGFVKEIVTYMVMDDLVVKPMSTISSITLLTKFDIKDLSDLEEKTVSFGKDEAIMLLKASLLTDKVLTSVFLGKNKGLICDNLAVQSFPF